MDISEKIELYLSEDGSSVKWLLRRLDRSLADVPVYSNRGFIQEVNVGFCSDERMFGKIFRIEANGERNNVPLGPYVVKNPLSMLDMLDSRSYADGIIYTIKSKKEGIDPNLFIIPSKMIITSASGALGQKFTIIAKEDPTMRLRQGI
ncbi:MAG: hypothetical protein QW814_00740 [Methanothrix sp.]